MSSSSVRCFVVNLRRRPDRRARIAAQLPWELKVEFTSDWPVEIDGRRLDRATLDAAGVRLHPWQIASDNRWWSRPLKWGEVGCSLAHVACWRAALAADVDHAIVLEDDAVLHDGWNARLNELLAGDPGADLIYLGRVPLEPNRSTVAAGVVEPGYSHCTYGYVLSRRGLQQVLAAGLDRSVIPVDEFLPAQYVRHPRPDVQARFPPVLTALAFDPPVVAQRAKDDAGSDTEDTEFVDAPTPPAGSPPA